MKSFAPLLIALAWLGACSKDIHNKNAVRQGVIDHLAARKNLDLDLSGMDVEVTAVSFRETEADATVSFRPKGSAGGGMEMRYTLERKGNQWRVKSKSETGGTHGAAEAPGGDLPAGHPPVSPSKPEP